MGEVKEVGGSSAWLTNIAFDVYRNFHLGYVFRPFCIFLPVPATTSVRGRLRLRLCHFDFAQHRFIIYRYQFAGILSTE